MFGSTILGVAIGLIFVYLLLSLICSAIYEIIEALLKRRASDLARGIRELLQDPDGTGLSQAVYTHPLVFGLFKGAYNPAGGSNLPSYIPARNFALALMDAVLPAHGATPSGAAGATTPTTPPAAGAVSPLAPLRVAIDNLPNGKAKQALRTLVDAAGDDVSRARANIESWYNSSMDRVSGWYKRRAQIALLFIGLAVAGLLNVDTISLGVSLSRDQKTREALATAAQEYVQQQQQQPAADKKAEDQLKENLKAVENLGLPIGWSRGNDLSVPDAGRIDQWALKVLGWVITALAVSLGAPFWFDLLNKFMVIRSTVKPHEKSREEKSND